MRGDISRPLFERVMHAGGARSPAWEMRFPGFTYRLWRVGNLDEEVIGARWVWEVITGQQPDELYRAHSKGMAEKALRERIMQDLGPLVGGLGRFVQQDRDWCFACGRTLPGAVKP